MYYHSNKQIAKEIAEKAIARGAAEGRPYGDIIKEEVQKLYDEEERKMGVIEPIKFDQSGRILYNPGLHHNQNKSWTHDELVYIIEWYAKIGIEELSLALSRSEGTVGAKIAELRLAGLMDNRRPPASTKLIPRTNNNIKYYKHKHAARGRRGIVSEEDAKQFVELKKTMTYVQIGEKFGVSKDTVYRYIQIYKKKHSIK